MDDLDPDANADRQPQQASPTECQDAAKVVDADDEVPVSVIVPSYNAERWLERAVRSLFVPGWATPGEVIVVDDASTDATVEMAEGLAAQLPSLRVVRRSANGGAAAARLDGAMASSNGWIALLDSDDYLDPGAIPMAHAEATLHDADLCIWELYRDESPERPVLVDTSGFSFPMSGRDAARLTLLGWKMHPLGVMRRDLFLSANKDVAVDTFNSDELVSRRVLLGARSIVSCPARYHYVENPDSTTLSGATNRVGRLRAQSWLMRFAAANGYLAEDRGFAIKMVNQGIGLAERMLADGAYAVGTQDAQRVTEDGEELLALLLAHNPGTWPTNLGIAKRTLARSGRLRSLKRQLRGRRAG